MIILYGFLERLSLFLKFWKSWNFRQNGSLRAKRLTSNSVNPFINVTNVLSVFCYSQKYLLSSVL